MDRRDEHDHIGTAGTSDTSGSTPRPQERVDTEDKSTVDKVAGVAASASGAVTMGLVGTLVGGPFGAIVGAIAGAVGGWWAGHNIAEHAPYREADEQFYRTHYELSTHHRADVAFESLRPAYQLGHFASYNPDYQGRSFDEIEPDLRHGWNDELRRSVGDWEAVRQYVRAAYQHRRSSVAGQEELTSASSGSGTWSEDMRGASQGAMRPEIGADLGGTESHHRSSFADPSTGFPDREVGSSGQATAGSSATSSSGRASGEPAWLRQPVDQGGFGAHIGSDASERNPERASPTSGPSADTAAPGRTAGARTSGGADLHAGTPRTSGASPLPTEGDPGDAPERTPHDAASRVEKDLHKGVPPRDPRE